MWGPIPGRGIPEYSVQFRVHSGALFDWLKTGLTAGLVPNSNVYHLRERRRILALERSHVRPT